MRIDIQSPCDTRLSPSSFRLTHPSVFSYLSAYLPKTVGEEAALAFLLQERAVLQSPGHHIHGSDAVVYDNLVLAYTSQYCQDAASLIEVR